MGRPKGSKQTVETRRKISIANKGRPTWNKGKKLPIYMRLKISKAHKGKHRGKDNNMWKGGRRKILQGYIIIHQPEHPFAAQKGYVMEHRLIMEKHIGRYLKKGEVVHHINNILDDNRMDNLMLFPNNTAHIQYHKEMRRKNDTKNY